jgi:hypothetical protein
VCGDLVDDAIKQGAAAAALIDMPPQSNTAPPSLACRALSKMVSASDFVTSKAKAAAGAVSSKAKAAADAVSSKVYTVTDAVGAKMNAFVGRRDPEKQEPHRVREVAALGAMLLRDALVELGGGDNAASELVRDIDAALMRRRVFESAGSVKRVLATGGPAAAVEQLLVSTCRPRGRHRGGSRARGTVGRRVRPRSRPTRTRS